MASRIYGSPEKPPTPAARSAIRSAGEVQISRPAWSAVLRQGEAGAVLHDREEAPQVGVSAVEAVGKGGTARGGSEAIREQSLEARLKMT